MNTSVFLAPNKPKDKHYALILMRFLGFPLEDIRNIYEWERHFKAQGLKVVSSTILAEPYSLNELLKTRAFNPLHAKILLVQAPEKILGHFNIQSTGNDVTFGYPTVDFVLEPI
jgi:hypothetical protein